MKKVVDVEVVEVDRRPLSVRQRGDYLRDSTVPAGSILDALASLDERRRAWERGFEAGVLSATTRLARGTREDVVAPEEEDTAPYPIVDPLE